MPGGKMTFYADKETLAVLKKLPKRTISAYICRCIKQNDDLLLKIYDALCLMNGRLD